jgi:hypothetical protein
MMTGPELLRQQQHNHPIEILNKDMFYRKLEYIHQNPVEAGFVTKQEEYLHISARNYYDGKGLIKLSFIILNLGKNPRLQTKTLVSLWDANV